MPEAHCQRSRVLVQFPRDDWDASIEPETAEDNAPMLAKERVRLAIAHREPDRVPIYEKHIDHKPASEILGHFAAVGYGSAIRGKLQNEMITEGRYDEYQAMQIAGRLELCRKLGLDIIRAFPYPRKPPVPRLIAENTWRVEDARGHSSSERPKTCAPQSARRFDAVRRVAGSSSHPATRFTTAYPPATTWRWSTPAASSAAIRSRRE